MFRFETTVAARHLRTGGGQSLLTILAVAAGVVVIIFISAITFGVRTIISSRLTDFIPSVTVALPDNVPPVLSKNPQSVSAKVEIQAQQLKFITHWSEAEQTIKNIPHVKVVAPTVLGAGIASYGGKQLGLQIYGGDPEELLQIMPLVKYLVSGHYVGLKSDEVFISYHMASELHISPGERLRVTSSEGVTSPFTVAGVYDPGQDFDIAYVTLRSGQSLFATQKGVHTILVGSNELFAADGIADKIHAVLGYKAESWSRKYPQFVSILGVYAAVAYLISSFSLIASAFAISSVLIVSVLQRSKEIGILKSIGAKRQQIMSVFVLQGIGIAVVGSSIGAIVGTLVVMSLRVFKQPEFRHAGPAEDMFPTYLTPTMVAVAMTAAIVTTVLAAAFPARRAAGLDPVQVMK